MSDAGFLFWAIVMRSSNSFIFCICLAIFEAETIRRRRHVPPSTRKIIPYSRINSEYIISQENVGKVHILRGGCVEMCRLRRLYCFLFQLEQYHLRGYLNKDLFFYIHSLLNIATIMNAKPAIPTLMRWL